MTSRFTPQEIRQMLSRFTPQELRSSLDNLSKKYQSFRYVINDQTGIPTINVGGVQFDTPAEALDYIKRLGITSVDTFDPSRPRYLRPGSGGQSYLRLDQLSEELSTEGITIERIGIKNSKKVLEEVQKEFGGSDPLAFMFSRGDTTTGLIFYQNGRKLSRSEIMGVLKNIGFYLGDDAKTIKRLSALTNIYQYGATKLNINALYFDPMQTQRAVAQMAEAGYSPVRKDGAISYRIASGRRVGEIRGDIQYGSMDDINEYLADIQNPLKTLSDRRSAEIINSHNLLTGRRVSRLDQLKPEEIIEAGRYIEAQTAVKMSVDGSVYGNARLIRKVRDYMRSEAQAIEDSLSEALRLDPNAAKTPEYIRAKRHLTRIRQNMEELKGVEINGGVMNVRVMGASTGKAEGFLGDKFTDGILRSMGIDPTSSEAKLFMGQGKGNIEIIGDRGKSLTNWKSRILDMMSGYGGQIEIRVDPKDGVQKLYNRATKEFLDPRDLDLIAPSVSITNEFGIVKGSRAAQMGGSISLETLGEGTRVFVDSQGLYADPELFDPVAIRLTTLRDVRKKIGSIKDDEILKEFAQYEEAKAAGKNFKTKGILKALIDVAENGSGEEKEAAERMLDMLRAGIGPSENPMFAKLFTSSLKEFAGGKEGIPHLLMPLIRQAEIGNTLASSSNVRRGFISYQKGKGFLLNDTDYYLYHKAFGGFDLDDMLRAHLAWDRTSDSLLSITKRTPGARGEIGVFEVDINDQLVDELLKDQSEYDDEIGRMIKQHLDDIQLTEAKIKLKRALSEGEKSLGGFSKKDFRFLASQIEGDQQEFFQSLLNPRTLDRDNLELLDTFLSTESIEDLESRAEYLRGEGRKVVLRGIKNGSAADEAKSLFGANERIFDHQYIEDRFINRSLALSDEALGTIAKYTKLSDEAMRKGREILGDQGATLADFMDYSIESGKNAQSVLGFYSNSRMVIDSIISNAHMMGERDKLNRLLSDDKIIRLLPQESVIDALTKEGGKNADLISEMTNENIDKLADILFENDLKIDRALIHNEFGRGKLNNTWVARISERLSQRGVSIEDYLVDGYYSEFMRSSQYTLDLINQEHKSLMRSLGLTKELKNYLFELDTEKEAEELYNIANTVYKTHNPLVNHDLEKIIYLGESEAESPTFARSVKLFEARKEFMRELLDRGHIKEVDGSFEVTDQGRRVIGSLMQRRGLADLSQLRGLTDIEGDPLPRASLMGGELEDIFNTTLAWFQRSNNQKAAEISSAPIGGRTSSFIRTAVQSTERSEEMADEISRIAPDLGREAYGRARAARGAADDIINMGREILGGSYTRINMENLKELFESSTMRKGAIALGGLVAFSAIYQKLRHRDRSPEDLQGPPMLPGGSFYDNTRNQYNVGISENSQQSSPNGVTYRVRAIGNYNPEQLSSSLEGLTGASVNSSTYQSRGFHKKKNAIEEAINHSFR